MIMLFVRLHLVEMAAHRITTFIRFLVIAANSRL